MPVKNARRAIHANGGAPRNSGWSHESIFFGAAAIPIRGPITIAGLFASWAPVARGSTKHPSPI